jgi:hypothetical protein
MHESDITLKVASPKRSLETICAGIFVDVDFFMSPESAHAHSRGYVDFIACGLLIT